MKSNGEHLKNDIMTSIGFVFKDKMFSGEKATMAKSLFNGDKRLINDILLEVHSGEEKYHK